jgi:hypothetical protein
MMSRMGIGVAGRATKLSFCWFPRFGKLVAEETEKWAKVVRFSGAKAE